MWPGSSRAGQDGKLMAQEQVLQDEVVARTYPGQDGREQQRDEFEHVFSIADSVARARFCRLTTSSSSG
jgi:hypothetical protein